MAKNPVFEAADGLGKTHFPDFTPPPSKISDDLRAVMRAADANSIPRLSPKRNSWSAS